MSELRDWLEEIACRAGLDGLPRPAAVAAAGVAVAAILLAVSRWGPWAVPPSGEADSAERGASAPAERARESSVTVHVVGAVARPGVVCLPFGSRASDAIEAAGGLREDAEPSAVNLARVVSDGEQIVVPVRGQAPAAGVPAGGGAPGAPGGKVNLNTGGIAELDALPGVGPATAAKIVADREENGPFRRPEDLMRVPGIGQKRFEQLKNLITTG